MAARLKGTVGLRDAFAFTCGRGRRVEDDGARFPGRATTTDPGVFLRECGSSCSANRPVLGELGSEREPLFEALRRTDRETAARRPTWRTARRKPSRRGRG